MNYINRVINHPAPVSKFAENSGGMKDSGKSGTRNKVQRHSPTLGSMECLAGIILTEGTHIRRCQSLHFTAHRCDNRSLSETCADIALQVIGNFTSQPHLVPPILRVFDHHPSKKTFKIM
jgi:hypothetical protein